ncbi:MAG: hypothetical protein PHG05_02210 [Candidatus Nanoarchaeia archaeon]|nr:hypothetical protein [Candidatus Nanoarchaeia archaeon]
MVKFEESVRRHSTNVFVCRRCKSKIRTTMAKVLKKKVSCRKCKGDALRPVRKGKKV